MGDVATVGIAEINFNSEKLSLLENETQIERFDYKTEVLPSKTVQKICIHLIRWI